MINQYNLRWSTWTLLLIFSLTLWQCGTSPCKTDKDCDVTQRCVAFSCQLDRCRPLKLEQKIQWSAERVPQTPWTLRITTTLQDTDLQWRFAPTVQKVTEGWDIQSTQFDPKSVLSQLVIIAYSKKQWEQPIQLSIQSDVYPHNQQEQDEIKCPSSWTSPPIQVACPKDTTDCDGLCTATQQNNEHCGSCGVVCANNTTCCAGVCVQLSNDTQHCGRCGQTCTAGDACCSGQCTSTRNNPAHCGACFQSCGGKTCCDSQCVETQSSRKHCGGCGQVCSGNCRVGVCFQCQRSSECSAGERCRYGQCVPCDTSNPCDTFLYLTNTLQSSNIALDKVGNIYIAGQFENQLKAGQTLLNSQGDKDLYFGKISPTGRWLWAYGAGSPGQELAAYITLDSQGSVYLTGHYGRNANGKPLQLQYNSTSPKTLPLPNNSNDTVFLAKFSSEGQSQWIRRLFGGINHWGNKAHTLPTGASRIAITPQDTASTKGLFCDFDNLFNGKDPLDTNGQMAIISLDTQGKCQWGRLAGTFNGHDSSELLSVDEKGHTYWGGVITGPSNFGSFSPIHYDKEDIALAKLDEKGSFLWATSFGGMGNDFPAGIQVDKDKNIYLYGRFTQNIVFGTKALTAQAKQDGFVSKLDTNGKPLWTLHCKSDEDVGINNGQLDAKGFLYVTGDFKGFAQCQQHTFQPPSGSANDGFVLKLDPTTGSILWSAAITGQGYEYVTSPRFATDGALHLLLGTTSQIFYVDGTKVQSPSVGGVGFLWRLSIPK